MSSQEDPSINICLLKNSFSENNIFGELESYKSTDIDTEKIELNIISIQSNRFPESLIDNYSKLKELQENLSDIDEIIRKEANPFESIGNSIFSTRAAVKLANIDSIFKLTGHINNIFSPQVYHSLSFCDIAGGPGAFSEYLFWRYPDASGYGITLKDAKGLGWSQKLIIENNFEPFNGGDGTGNLYTNCYNFEKFILEKNSDGVNLAVADGGFEVKGDDYRRKEFISSRLITIEFYLGFVCIKQGGNFVCKVFDTVTAYMYDIIYLLSFAFEEIIMFKPMSSRPANEERYLVCKNRKENIIKVTELFRTVIESFTDDSFLESILLHDSPNDYTKWMDEQNNLSIDRQIKYINSIIGLSKGTESKSFDYNNHKALLIWDLPGNIEPLRKRSIKIRDTPITINYDKIGSFLDIDTFLESEDYDQFPYRSLYFENQDIINMFKALKLYKWRKNIYFLGKNEKYTIKNSNITSDELKYKGLQEYITIEEEEYHKYNIIPDTFSSMEHIRLDTSIDYYYNNLGILVEYSLKNFGKITPHTMREALYFNNKEANLFFPNLVVGIIDMFQAKSMLDFSPRYGETLIGAMASGISYIGISDNNETYNEMISFFCDEKNLNINCADYQIINSMKNRNIKHVDLIMTYISDNETYLLYNKYIDESIRLLNNGGYLVLAINQTNDLRKFIDKINEMLSYLGIISYKYKNDTGDPQPMLIWRKNTPRVSLIKIDISMQRDVRRITEQSKNYIGTEDYWDKEKLSEFMKHQDNEENNYWRLIQVDGRVEGLIGIYLAKDIEDFVVTIFINKRHMTYGQQALILALEYNNNVDYINAFSINTRFYDIFEKANFEFANKIGNSKTYIYKH